MRTIAHAQDSAIFNVVRFSNRKPNIRRRNLTSHHEGILVRCLPLIFGMNDDGPLEAPERKSNHCTNTEPSAHGAASGARLRSTVFNMLFGALQTSPAGIKIPRGPQESFNFAKNEIFYNASQWASIVSNRHLGTNGSIGPIRRFQFSIRLSSYSQ